MNGSETGLRYHWIDAIHVRETTGGAAQPPRIATIGNRTLDELTTLSIQLAATDPDSPASSLTWSITAGPAGLVINPQSGILTWTPTESAGPGDFTVTA